MTIRVLAATLAALVALTLPGTAQAKGLRGHCGMHFGALYRIDSSGARYHARIGPKHTGGSMYCHGKVLVRHPANVPGSFISVWTPFDWPSWNWKGILATNGTAASCVGFGIALAGEAPTGAVDTWLTASAGAGCASGVGYIMSTFLDPHPSPDYCHRHPCNGPRVVPFR